MNNALVIVDMQFDFYASRGKAIINEHLHQINQAKSNNDQIIVLEFDDCFPTNKKIQNSLKYYPYVKYITKKTCSGSSKIVSFFKKQSFWPKEISFMGVNTGICVYRTVFQFHNHIKKNNKETKIKVIKNGCRCISTTYFGDFSIFNKYEVEIV